MHHPIIPFLTAIFLAATVIADDAVSPKAQSDALVKEAQAAVKENRLDDAFNAFEKAWSVEGLTPGAMEKVMGSARWAFTFTTRDPAMGHKVCDTILAHPKATPGSRYEAMNWKAKTAREGKKFAEAREWQGKIRDLPDRKPDSLASSFVFDAETFVEEGGTDAVKNAVETYGKAFAVPELPRGTLDSIRLKAIKTLAGKADVAERVDAARKISDKVLADKETGAKTRYETLMQRANWAKTAKDEKALYAEAMAAAKVPGEFDRRGAYYLLAGYELGKGTVSRHEEPEHVEKYLKLMDQAYEAGVKEMGLPPEQAAHTYLKVALMWAWHMGRPARDVTKARAAFDKAVACGATEKSGYAHDSFNGVKSRIEDLERRYAQFEKFPNRNWRNEDGKLFEEIDKTLSAGKTVHAKDFGWNKDDATEALQKAVDSDASVIIVDKMPTPWEIEGVIIPSCKKVVLRKGVVLEAKKGGLLKSHAFVRICGTNVVFVGEGDNEIRMRKSDYMNDKKTYPSFDDNRHGLGFGGIKGYKGPKGNILVRNVKISSSGGDGVCITGSRRIWLDHVELYDHLRQALTLGTGSDIVYLTNCKFNNTWGGEPMSGIDIENWTENCSICEIYCEDCEFADNRIFGLCFATSTYSPLTTFFKNCEFRNNGSTSLNILNRPGVPTPNKEIFENCRFLQARCVPPIRYGRTLIGNMHFKDCLIQEIPGGDSFGTASPITVQLDANMSDYFVGKNVFENLKVIGYEDAPLLSLTGRNGGTEYIPDGAFEGVVDFNGKKIDLAQYIKERDYDKPAPEYKAEPLDLTKLTPPPLNSAVDAYLPGPYGGSVELLYWAKAGRRIKLAFFTRVTGWTHWQKGRAISVVKPDGAKEVICGLDYTNDYTTTWYEIPSDGFYRFRAPGNGYWIPQDDQTWGYSYRTYAGDGFLQFSRLSFPFTGFFEVPKGVKEVTIQTQGGQYFEMVDANNKTMAKSGPSSELKTWKCKVEAPGVWRFRILRGHVRFFPPLNGIVADCPENLPRMAQ